jgi:hypothetical protein
MQVTVWKCGEMCRESNVAALHLVHEVVAGANAEGHDGERGILARVGGKTRSVHDEKIFDVVGLLKLI